MSDTEQISATEAIRQVIAETNHSFDFVDIVNAVHKRFRIGVTPAQVEEVIKEIKEGKPAQAEVPRPRTTVSMVTNPIAQAPTPVVETKPVATSQTSQAPAEPAAPNVDNEAPSDLDHAIRYVRSVGGLAKAKRILMELESVLLGIE